MNPSDPRSDPLPTPTWGRKLARWWCVLRYHRPSQLAARLVSMVHTRAGRPLWNRRCARLAGAVPRLRENPGLQSLSRRKLADRLAGRPAQQTHDLLAGRFRFLNTEHALPDPVDWRLQDWPDAPHLWRFHLHYHEFLLDLAARGMGEKDPVWLRRAWDLVSQWIEGNRLSDPRVLRDAWHPYCISRRLPAWISLWTASPPARDLGNRILGSMLAQARYLEAHLEWDVRGNHLLENAKALATAGAFLDCPDAERWLRKAARLVRSELAAQVLPHGEHFERSPMYHAQVLEGVLEVRDAVAALDPDLARLCGKTAQRMAGFLRQILHPDGEIPLLGDACFGETLPADRVLAWAQQDGGEPAPPGADLEPPHEESPGARVVGDYWIHRHRGDFLLFDAGPVGPDHLPAHAHADLLTLEASVAGRRLLVDSGVFNYQDDPMRRYCRSSAAHNVLQIDGQDQCDVWSRFRMGYRGWPFGFAAGEESGFPWARACHNAYRRLGVPVVGRWVACRPGGPWLCVDWAEGSGRHELTLRLHLHPQVVVTKTAGNEFLLDLDGTRLTLRYLAAGQLAVSDGWYCPQLGCREKTQVLQWTSSASLPAVCGWSLTWKGCEGVAALDQTGSGRVVLRWSENGKTLQWQPAGRL